MNTDTHRFKHKELTGKQFVRWTRFTRPSCCNYLRATDIELGLLLNFGLKPEFKRMVFDNSRKLQRKLSKSLLGELLDTSD